jgi:hypothetical protein
MLSVGEAFVLARDRRNLIADADHKMSILEVEIARLRNEIGLLQHQMELKDVVMKGQTRQRQADTCTIAGYRAYVEHMRSVCDEGTLIGASDAYMEACNAKADEIGSPRLKKT